MKMNLTWNTIVLAAIATVIIGFTAGCRSRQGGLEHTGGYSAGGHVEGLRVWYACETWKSKPDTVSYAVYCQAETKAFSFDSDRDIRINLAGKSDKWIILPYEEGRQYWIDPKGQFRIIDHGLTTEELLRFKELSEQDPGLQTIQSFEDLKRFVAN